MESVPSSSDADGGRKRGRPAGIPRDACEHCYKDLTSAHRATRWRHAAGQCGYIGMRAKLVQDAMEVGQYPYGDDDTSGKGWLFSVSQHGLCGPPTCSCLSRCRTTATVLLAVTGAVTVILIPVAVLVVISTMRCKPY
jgi:hypothetical protein